MAEAPVEIEFTVWGSWDQIYGLLMDHLYADTNIVLEIGSAPFGQYHDRLLTRFASGDLPDIAMLVDFDFARFQNRGFLTDLTSYVEDHPDWDINAPGYNHFYPVITDFFKSEGKPFAIPAEVNPMGIGFNIDMFEEAGIPTPHEQWQAGTWTWDAFVETALEMKRGEGDETIYGWTGGPARIWNISNRIWQNGGDVFNEDKTQVVVNEPAGHEAIQWMFDLYLVHELGPANLRSPDAGAGGLFQQGRLAMRDVGTWTRKGLEESDIQLGRGPTAEVRQARLLDRRVFLCHPQGFGNPGRGLERESRTPPPWRAPSSSWRTAGPAARWSPPWSRRSFVFEPPKHAEAFLDMLASAHPQPFIRRNQEFLEIWDREMDLVAIGEKTAQAATETIKTEVEPLLVE